MISMECGIDSTRLKRGDFSAEEEWKIKEAVETVDDLPIYIDDAPGLTATAILSRARRAVAKHGVELIVVDYLQLVKAENPRASRYEAVTDTSIAIAQMAKSLKVPVIAMAQLSRKLLDRVNFDFSKFKPEQTRPHDGDLRDSGQIEQDAHAVIFLNRPYPIIEGAAPAEGGEDFDSRMMAWQEACSKWKRRAEVSVHMNWAGETGTVEFIFKGETSQWEESPLQTYFSGGGLKAPLNFMPAGSQKRRRVMGKPAGFKGVIKPVNWGLNFVIVPREFAQDMTISPFTKAVLLDVQSRSENWETNSSTIMHNYKVGRNKARSVLSEGMRAGYVYAHHSRDARERILPITYHFSTCRRTLREFVVGNGWETEESYALKIQALGEEEGPGTEKQGPGFPGPGDETQRKERIDERREDEKEAASGFSHSEPPSFDAFLSARKGGKAAGWRENPCSGG